MEEIGGVEGLSLLAGLDGRPTRQFERSRQAHCP